MTTLAANLPKRILIVDDEYSIRLGFSLALNSEEYSVVSEAEPARALERMQVESFDLMILDMLMPSMDGLTMAQLQMDREIFIPTILASAMATTDNMLAALRLGIVDFLTKPIQINELRLAVKHLLWRQSTFSNLPLPDINGLSINHRFEAAKFYVQRRERAIATKILSELLAQEKDPDSEMLFGMIAEVEKQYDLAGKHYAEGVSA